MVYSRPVWTLPSGRPMFSRPLLHVGVNFRGRGIGVPPLLVASVVGAPVQEETASVLPDIKFRMLGTRRGVGAEHPPWVPGSVAIAPWAVIHTSVIPRTAGAAFLFRIRHLSFGGENMTTITVFLNSKSIIAAFLALIAGITTLTTA
jgi:hypothetical protein